MRDEVVDPEGAVVDTDGVSVDAEGVEESHTVEPDENSPYSTLNILAVAGQGGVFMTKLLA